MNGQRPSTDWCPLPPLPPGTLPRKILWKPNYHISHLGTVVDWWQLIFHASVKLVTSFNTIEEFLENWYYRVEYCLNPFKWIKVWTPLFKVFGSTWEEKKEKLEAEISQLLLKHNCDLYVLEKLRPLPYLCSQGYLSKQGKNACLILSDLMSGQDYDL